jgi:hypothetical protein
MAKNANVAKSPVAGADTAPKRIGIPSTEVNPFDRYLSDAKKNWPEPALVRFATMCGLEIDSIAPRFAQRPKEEWVIVKDLSGAQQDQETDFYGTLAVWHRGDRTVAEEWGMELDTGDYFRLFFCLRDQTILNAESVSWKTGLEENGGDTSGWGYDVKWNLNAKGESEMVSKRFVNLREMPIPEPSMDADTIKDLAAIGLAMKTWKDLRYPDQMLR